MKNHPNSNFLKNLPKGVPLRQIAVMNVEEGEEVLGGYVTPHIPQIGIYKLLAKKKRTAPANGHISSNGMTDARKMSTAARWKTKRVSRTW